MLSCDSSSLKVLLVDDHELTLLTLKFTFSCQENMEVVGLASNGQQAIEIVKSCQPDVVVLDLQMPVMDGWLASSYIKSIFPKTQILAFSSLEDLDLQQTKAMSTFDGVCRKNTPTSELVQVVRRLGERVKCMSSGS
ncbi:MAG: response regulator transcription factor [Sphaerospermopsis sp. SIO1G2]|nr:response regulator transcription factor [Sphaerospermopsis sp. SIO1G1]NET69484.1 response regulator transcription factor [Sphaerospermopsis sp. SIO1G2]